MQLPHMQSQQSFTMSQQSQQSVGNSSMYRQYNDSGRQNGTDNEMPIYSVGPDFAQRVLGAGMRRGQKLT
jgi:hypothetical protein